MNTTFILALCALIATVLACAWQFHPTVWRKNIHPQITRFRAAAAGFTSGVQLALIIPWRIWHRAKKVALSNVAEGYHEGSVTRLTDAAITTRHLLYKVGTDADHVAVCGSTSIPLGTIADEADAAEENVAVQLLGQGRTLRMVASEAMASAGVLVYMAANGKIALTGTQCVGVNLTTASADGDIVEVLSVVPPPSPGIAASTFNAHTVLYATTDDTPVALTVGEQRMVGRITGGNIVALTGAQILGITDPITYDATTVAAATLAIPKTHRTVQKTTGAGAEALTLANGDFLGQKLHIVLVTDGGGDGTLTPTNPSGFATIVFADAGDTVDLEWTTDGWILTGSAGVAAPPVITV